MKKIDIILSNKKKKNSVLSEVIVYEILIRLCTFGTTIRQMSDLYNTDYQNINTIIKGITFKKSFSKLTKEQKEAIHYNINSYNEFDEYKIQNILIDLWYNKITCKELLKNYHISIGHLKDISIGAGCDSIYRQLTIEQQNRIENNFKNDPSIVPLRKGKLSKYEVHQVLILTNTNEPYEIAQQFNVSCKRIRKIIKEHLPEYVFNKSSNQFQTQNMPSYESEQRTKDLEGLTFNTFTKIIQLLKNNLSHELIAKKFNLDISIIKDIFEEKININTRNCDSMLDVNMIDKLLCDL